MSSLEPEIAGQTVFKAIFSCIRNGGGNAGKIELLRCYVHCDERAFITRMRIHVI